MDNSPALLFKRNAVSALFIASITLGGVAGCGGGGGGTDTPVSPPLIDAEATTGSKVMSWFAQIADSLYDVALGVAAVAEGDVEAGVAEFAAAGLGIISKGLESGDSGNSGDDQAKQLSVIDGKLDTLIVDVQSLAGQLTTVENQVANLAAYDMNTAVMAQQMQDAQTWLDLYYTNPTKTLQSREWVRWYMAGCDPVKAVACPSASNPVTADRLAAFRQVYMKNTAKKTMTFATDNFPLWWAYGVLGDLTTGASNYVVNGNKADDIVSQIYTGITNNMGTSTNGLVSYMNFVMTQSTSHCATDVTDPACDLFNNVYLPLETYFSLAVGRQSQLVMAQAEAYTVLAQKDPGAYRSAGANLMNNFNKQLNEEAEAFLQVAEQIALYRVADGRTDWTNFATTDAGQLLARADFIVAKLTGKNYIAGQTTRSTLPTGQLKYTSSPWPSSGIVGRVFYANGEQMPTAARAVCSASSQSCSNSSLPQIAEISSTPAVTVTNAQPYLVWSSQTDANTKVVTMTGTANNLWHVQRLVPQAATALQVGADYLVASTHSPSLLAKFGFYNYDDNFDRSAAANASSVTPFGSFSSVEGAVGRNGFKFDKTIFKDSVNMSSVVYAPSYDVSLDNPGAMSYSLTYVPNDYYTKYVVNDSNMSKWGGVGTTAGTWSASTVVKLVIPSGSASNVKLSWPSTLDVNLSGQAHYSSENFRTQYYSYSKFEQQILGSASKPLTDSGGKAGDVVADCGAVAFSSCQINKDQSIDMTVSTATATASNLTFVARFSTEVEQYDKSGIYKVIRTSIAPSVANWTIQTPIVTLIK